MAFVRVCLRDEVPVGEGRKFEIGRAALGRDAIAVFNIDGEFFAIEDECSHGQWSLAEGYVDGDLVECALHMAKFCVRTGKACTLPATESVMVFPLRLQGEEVLVDLAAGHYTD